MTAQLQQPTIIKGLKINTYSCQICQDCFTSIKDLIIIPYENPLCSQKCHFKLLFRILSNYDINDLVYLKNYYSVKISKEDNRNNVIYKIIKEFIKQPSPTIKHLSVLSTAILITLITLILINTYQYHQTPIGGL